ncbi:molybdopterin molybdotransferase MoeA [Idiomarina sp. HP20-50]|uniref:molybdopterin molybdotransferase MoeA n=1 Tax=Idiomarina sp. HP20-50 TaxID=3070813 RepID=UPI00294B7566|nr:molybdopterin molybdotransferase MoeA [Idiomarina sp. HP20-50]MDV6316342.1 molybdopterin molybdotransferase MoeA [Idiomarina sp. HP20-50]
MSNPSLMPVEQALENMLNTVSKITDKETVELPQALGRIVNRPVNSTLDVPGYDNSAMDGYAVRSSEASKGASLTVVGVAAAGHPFNDDIPENGCVRIMTGAPIPNSMDAVVIQENTEANSDHSEITVLQDVPENDNIRRRGSDIALGEEVIPTGTRLSAVDIGLLASLGIAEVAVFRKPKVAVFSTGDELVAPGDKLKSGQIYDSNRYLLIAMLEKLGVDVVNLGRLNDDLDAISQALEDATQSCDAVITSGGVSVGDADFTKMALEQLGSVSFWKVAMKPGKPFAFGKLKNTWFFGLPGNPVAAAVTMDQLAQPVLKHLAGEKHISSDAYQAVAAEGLKKRPGRADFQRGWLEQNKAGQLTVSSAGSQSSAVLSTFRRANCFIRLEQERDTVKAGEEVTVLPFSTLLR